MRFLRLSFIVLSLYQSSLCRSPGPLAPPEFGVPLPNERLASVNCFGLISLFLSSNKKYLIVR